MGGRRPVVAIYSTFLQRAFDQTVHDACQNDQPVVLAVDRAGLVGEDGTSHQGMFTLPAQRQIPHLVIASPKDEQELRSLLRTAFAQDHPFALHYPRDPGFDVPAREPAVLPIGGGETLREGTDVVIIGFGPIVARGMAAAETLAADGWSVGVINARFAKPLDRDRILAAARAARLVVTLEESVETGGFGSAVLELLEQARFTEPALRDRAAEDHRDSRRSLRGPRLGGRPAPADPARHGRHRGADPRDARGARAGAAPGPCVRRTPAGRPRGLTHRAGHARRNHPARAAAGLSHVIRRRPVAGCATIGLVSAETIQAGRGRRQRLDQLLVERGLAETRSRAQALVMAGQVRVGEGDGARRDRKPGDLVDPSVALAVDRHEPYVSRGGHKLAAALDAFAIDPAGLVCLDAGASTGGFTDVLLQRGARRVLAVDVGRGQLADTLRRDPRVTSYERRTRGRSVRGSWRSPWSWPWSTWRSSRSGWCSARSPPASDRRAARWCRSSSRSSRPVVRRSITGSSATRPSTSRCSAAWWGRRAAIGLAVDDVIASPILGPDGNREFLLRMGAGPAAVDGTRSVDPALDRLTVDRLVEVTGA